MFFQVQVSQTENTVASAHLNAYTNLTTDQKGPFLYRLPSGAEFLLIPLRIDIWLFGVWTMKLSSAYDSNCLVQRLLV